MELHEAVSLLEGLPFRPSVPATWADLGCGSGLFTRALAKLLPGGSLIYAIDRELQSVSAGIHQIEFIQADFVQDSLSIPPLDGILMANSLHYVHDKENFIKRIRAHLHHDSSFIIVEYDTTHANPWVPYPLSYVQLETLFRKEGFTSIRKLSEQESRFHKQKIYSALIH